MIKAAQFICGKAFPVVQNIYAPGLSRGPITLSKTAHTHNTVSKYLPDGRKGLNIDFKPIVLENNCDTYMLSSYQRTWPPALLCDHFVPSLGTYCFNCGVFNWSAAYSGFFVNAFFLTVLWRTCKRFYLQKRCELPDKHQPVLLNKPLNPLIRDCFRIWRNVGLFRYLTTEATWGVCLSCLQLMDVSNSTESYYTVILYDGLQPVV